MEATQIFGRVITAMATPFSTDGAIDFGAAQRLATHLVDTGCDGVLVSGTTGEAPTTYGPEKSDLIRAVKEAVGARARVIAGAGSNDTAHAVRMAEQARLAGADAILVVSPYYNRPSQDGVAAHIETVAEAGQLPVMVYDIPGRTGVAIGPACSERICRHPLVAAFKDAAGDPVRGGQRGERCGVAVYSGDDALNLSFLAHGAAGVVSVVAHVAADRYRAMVEAMTPDGAGRANLLEARRIHLELAPLVEAVMGAGQGAVMVKHAMALAGVIPSATLRLPLVAAPAEAVAELRVQMAALGYLPGA